MNRIAIAIVTIVDEKKLYTQTIYLFVQQQTNKISLQQIQKYSIYLAEKMHPILFWPNVGALFPLHSCFFLIIF